MTTSTSRWAVILGDDEVARGEVTLKDLVSGEQTTLARFRLIETLRAAARPPAKETYLPNSDGVSLQRPTRRGRVPIITFRDDELAFVQRGFRPVHVVSV